VDPENVTATFEVRSLTRSWDNNDWSFGWGLRFANPKSWGRGGRRGSEMIPFERALLISYIGPRPSIVTFPLSLRVSEILPRLCSSTPLFSPTSIIIVSSKNFPCSSGNRWIYGLWATKSKCVGLIVRALSFQDFQHVATIHQRHRRTDRQTDRRHAIAIPRFAL